MRITRQAMGEVEQHASDGYPNEICGALIAAHKSGLVTRTRRITNIVVDRARDRYEMDIGELRRLQRECDDAKLDIAGFYHSHPDHPAWASKTDSERSWTNTTYLIVSCAKGVVVDANAFEAEKDQGEMHQVPLEIVD